MEKSNPQTFNPAFVTELILAAEEAAHAMRESVNLDFAVGYDGREDVQNLDAALDRLSDALRKIKSA